MKYMRPIILLLSVAALLQGPVSAARTLPDDDPESSPMEQDNRPMRSVGIVVHLLCSDGNRVMRNEETEISYMWKGFNGETREFKSTYVTGTDLKNVFNIEDQEGVMTVRATRGGPKEKPVVREVNVSRGRFIGDVNIPIPDCDPKITLGD